MSIMSRQPGRPRKQPPVTATPLSEVISGEMCDRCGAEARHRVIVPYPTDIAGLTLETELLFCSHHYGQHQVVIAVLGYRVT